MKIQKQAIFCRPSGGWMHWRNIRLASGCIAARTVDTINSIRKLVLKKKWVMKRCLSKVKKWNLRNRLNQLFVCIACFFLSKRRIMIRQFSTRPQIAVICQYAIQNCQSSLISIELIISLSSEYHNECVIESIQQHWSFSSLHSEQNQTICF